MLIALIYACTRHLISLKNCLKFAHLNHSIAVQIDLVKQILYIFFIYDILIGTTSKDKFLVVYKPVIVCVHIIEDFFPFNIVRKPALEFINTCFEFTNSNESCVRSIDSFKNFRIL